MNEENSMRRNFFKQFIDSYTNFKIYEFKKKVRKRLKNAKNL